MALGNGRGTGLAKALKPKLDAVRGAGLKAFC